MDGRFFPRLERLQHRGGVLVEGWNKGWDGDWFGTGWDFSFTQAYPDFVIAEVARYARSKNVQIVGHHETAGNIANYEKQMGAFFKPSALLEKLAAENGKFGSMK